MAALLILTILLPLAGGIALLAGQKAFDRNTARKTALGTVLVTLFVGLPLHLGFDPSIAGPQFAFGKAGSWGLPWIGSPDIRLAFGLDGLSLGLFSLTSLLMVSAVCASWDSIQERAPLHYALLLFLHSGLLGLFAALDIVLFYIFFEFTLIPLFFLVGIYGGPDRRKASVTLFVYTIVGGMLTLMGVLLIVAIHAQYGPTHKLSFSIPDITDGLRAMKWDPWMSESLWGWQTLIFLLLFAGFAIKVPLFPFHSWLPLAHVEAPTAGSILLAGVLLKVGGYGLIRFNLGMTPLGAKVLFPFLATLAVTGAIYGALAALAQKDIKRLVAYSSVSHMGIICLGLFALNSTGISGAAIQMINHGLTTGALFACVGVVYERYHTRDMSALGGLWNRMPKLAFFLILASLGSVALPGLNGFVGEFPILVGMYKTSPVAGALAATSMVLGAFYTFWMIQRVIFGPLREPGHGHGTHLESARHDHADHAHDNGVAHHDDHHDHHHEPVRIDPLKWHEILGLTPLIVFIVLIGIRPGYFTRPLNVPIEKMAVSLGDSKVAVEPAKSANILIGTTAPSH
jgi:NADH-quinone oxidoreductase subunit M